VTGRKTKDRLDREIAEVLAKRTSGRNHSTKSSSFDKDDARRFGQFAFRMERTKAQAVADARAEGFGSWQLEAVEEGWDAERRDTAHGGFAGTSHATRRKARGRGHSTKSAESPYTVKQRASQAEIKLDAIPTSEWSRARVIAVLRNVDTEALREIEWRHMKGAGIFTAGRQVVKWSREVLDERGA
jgi:hypothetical protein